MYVVTPLFWYSTGFMNRPPVRGLAKSLKHCNQPENGFGSRCCVPPDSINEHFNVYLRICYDCECYQYHYRQHITTVTFLNNQCRHARVNASQAPTSVMFSCQNGFLHELTVRLNRMTWSVNGVVAVDRVTTVDEWMDGWNGRGNLEL